jgi:hypothetical protein
MELVVRVEEALCIPNRYSFTNAVAFTLALPPPKALDRCIMFTLHLNRSWPLLDSKFGGSFQSVKAITILQV